MSGEVPIDDLAKLAELRDKGVISEDEFQTMKRKLLAGDPLPPRPEATISGEGKGYDFTEAIASGFRNYATFAGRAPRSEYWFWTLFTVLGSIATSIADGALGFGSWSKTGPFNALFLLATLLPGIAMWVRRLHDVNRSGWWAWIMLIPIVGWILMLVWNCTRGDAEQNEYGPDPLG